MVSGYGETAVSAADLLEGGVTNDPVEAWRKSAEKCFPSSASMRDKGCPRQAFLGLCGAGLIRGVLGDNDTRNPKSKNGGYAVEAVKILRANRFLVSQPEILWREVAGNSKTHNNQMDVVIALWQAGRII